MDAASENSSWHAVAREAPLFSAMQAENLGGPDVNRAGVVPRVWGIFPIEL